MKAREFEPRSRAALAIRQSRCCRDSVTLLRTEASLLMVCIVVIERGLLRGTNRGPGNGAHEALIVTGEGSGTQSKRQDIYAEIARLDELRKSGALTQDEFDAEKKKILSHSK